MEQTAPKALLAPPANPIPPAAQAIVDVAKAHGVIGWDIAMGKDGPLVIECNANPFHMLYQLATGRGVMNADHMPRFDAAAAYSKKISDERNQLARDRIKDRKQ